MVRDGKPTSYTIIINEAQREALLTLIKDNPGVYEPDMPLEYWEQMLEGLPKDELAHPNVLHGFCL